MWSLFRSGLILSSLGVAGLLRALILVCFSPSGDDMLTTAGWTTLGVLCFVIGLACLVLSCHFHLSAKRRWADYAPNALACAEAVRGGTACEFPHRPGPVAGKIFDESFPDALSTGSIESLTEKKIKAVLADLMSPAGEVRCYLGKANAIVYTHTQLAYDPAEEISNAYVIDREWEDGRWTSEWLCLVVSGQRLRIVGGAATVGPFQKPGMGSMSDRRFRKRTLFASILIVAAILALPPYLICFGVVGCQ